MVVTWTLIVLVYASTIASDNPVALTSVPGFETEIACRIAGRKTSNFSNSHKSTKFVCVRMD